RTEDVFHFEHGRRANSGLSTALARIHAHIMATGVTVRGNHFEPAEFDAADRAPLRAILAVPLRAGDRLLGLLAVQGSTPDAYSADDQMLLEMLAAQAAIAFENARLFANTQRLANLDPLTRLYNRRHFFDLGQREFERVARHHSPLTILIADIDHFKRVNDTRGHLAGDQVLRAVAAGFRESLRDVDIIGRYGGEEFVVLMPETDMPEARRAGERLMQRLAHAPIPTDRGPVSVTLSLGLAEMEAGYDISLETLLDRADQALYAAKQAGRDRLVCWDSRLPFRSQFGPAPA
ncbi:MAG: sensor domain-containing diguanylate cyclase, partial [Anaerolineales bacterium]|nr:sensor domain-containing diguanylate cyclase [Anaerolineales bacterium]